jgi:hypothetical protein
MSTTIICPNCKTQFEPEAAIAQSVEERVRKEFNQKWVDLEKKKDEQFRQKELQWQQQQEETLKKAAQDMSSRINAEYENKLRLLEDANKTNEAKLSEAREKELDFLKKMQELKTKEQELDIELQRKLLEERNKLADVIKKEEEEKNRLRDTEFQMRLAEKEKQLDDQRKLIEEMKRKSEQGSMQLQGEVQELALEQMLAYAFPFDVVSEVGKGVRGADCIQTVRNNFGQECGKIIFESKRTKDFSAEWIEKLKADMRVLGADIAVIVTQAMPKDMEGFGEKNGIWICGFNEVRALVQVLREMILRVHIASKSQENKGEKMTMLYDYFTSSEFAGQWRAIREGYMSMKVSIQKEREQMEKLWKAREKQLEKVLLNAAHIKGSIEGIAGMDVDLNLLPEAGESYLLE